eukprot:130892-Chlamydomonas_euryale.AAC.9
MHHPQQTAHVLHAWPQRQLAGLIGVTLLPSLVQPCLEGRGAGPERHMESAGTKPPSSYDQASQRFTKVATD